MSYSRLVARRALTETKSVWNVHRVWIYFASPLTGLLARAVFVGVKNLGNWQQILLFAVIGFVITWLGTYLINLIRVPAILHREQLQALSEAQSENSQLSEKLSNEHEHSELLSQQIIELRKAKRSAADEYNYRLAKDALSKLPPDTPEVLRHSSVNTQNRPYMIT